MQPVPCGYRTRALYPHFTYPRTPPPQKLFAPERRSLINHSIRLFLSSDNLLFCHSWKLTCPNSFGDSSSHCSDAAQNSLHAGKIATLSTASSWPIQRQDGHRAIDCCVAFKKGEVANFNRTVKASRCVGHGGLIAGLFMSDVHGQYALTDSNST